MSDGSPPPPGAEVSPEEVKIESGGSASAESENKQAQGTTPEGGEQNQEEAGESKQEKKREDSGSDGESKQQPVEDPPIWESEDPHTHVWVPYEDDFQTILENAFSNGHSQFQAKLFDRPYTFDFGSMEQINPLGYPRKIRRTTEWGGGGGAKQIRPADKVAIDTRPDDQLTEVELEKRREEQAKAAKAAGAAPGAEPQGEPATSTGEVKEQAHPGGEDIPEAAPEGVKFVWESEDPTTGAWIPYDPATSDDFERHFLSKVPGFNTVLFGRSYLIDFGKMMQINQFHHGRKLRRIAVDVEEAMVRQLTAPEAGPSPGAKSAADDKMRSNPHAKQKKLEDGTTVWIDTNPAHLENMTNGQLSTDHKVSLVMKDNIKKTILDGFVVGTTSEDGERVCWIRPVEKTYVRKVDIEAGERLVPRLSAEVALRQAEGRPSFGGGVTGPPPGFGGMHGLGGNLGHSNIHQGQHMGARGGRSGHHRRHDDGRSFGYDAQDDDDDDEHDDEVGGRGRMGMGAHMGMGGFGGPPGGAFGGGLGGGGPSMTRPQPKPKEPEKPKGPTQEELDKQQEEMRAFMERQKTSNSALGEDDDDEEYHFDEDAEGEFDCDEEEEEDA